MNSAAHQICNRNLFNFCQIFKVSLLTLAKANADSFKDAFFRSWFHSELIMMNNSSYMQLKNRKVFSAF